MSGYDDETLRVSGEVTPVSTPSASIDHGRFVPGALIGSRYRIVALLGKGGMGEVYRADDLLLGQSVALKFLPQRIGGNANALARLLGEVRIARQISHPNVCRVYDIGEVNGEHFISMEYVQGEDLRSLLHRIGRFPADRGVEIARQICAGLAAAHDRGVLHRDLKPANVMIDERGTARITDFGLAVLADSGGAQQREGTPAYMSPEQLDGDELTTRSDIYSLGLVLYELFTGKMLFDAKTLTELLEMRRSATVKSIRLSNDVDPAIERAIQRCLDEAPERRPKTATAVAAALPGGNPLDAALAAGETPSPAVVAAAGPHHGIEPAHAFMALGAILVLLALVLFCKPKIDLLARSGVHESPETMAVHARDLLARAGYTQLPRDRAWRYRAVWIGRGAVVYWYRESPEVIEPTAFFRHLFVELPGIINPSEPPLETPGESLVELDPAGRLISLRVVPPLDSRGDGAQPADWNALLQSAGFDPASLKPIAATRNVVPFDQRVAWMSGKLRIEAASMDGRPVYFELIPPQLPQRSGGPILLIAMFTLTLLVGGLLAWRNVRRKRGDLAGATRFGIFIGLSMMAAWLFGADHVLTLTEAGMIVKALSWASFIGLAMFTTYLALEPLFRRRWPHSMVSWARLVSGQFRDPVVGRDLLAGVFGGVLMAASTIVVPVIAAQIRGTAPVPQLNYDISLLNGTRHVIADLLSAPSRIVAAAFISLTVLVVLKVITRREWIAAAGLIVIHVLLNSGHTVSGAIGAALPVLILLALLHRFGFLAVITRDAVNAMLLFAPVLWPPA
ncbi:MAG TPA: serine/threonine-protein kinase, partial [Thermoanaerobaculia bacterium]|nr:serine/threonine-protein kinase [Thermoanaerobaculia bacterium]